MGVSGDISGRVYQAGRDIVLGASNDGKQATYNSIPKLQTPLTQSVLGWASLVVGLLSLLPIGKLFQQFLILVQGEQSPLTQYQPGASWLVLSLIMVFFVVGICLPLYRIAKRNRREPLFFGWAVSGVNGRIALEKVKPDPCPTCGGGMKYLATPTKQWEYEDGRAPKVVEKAPALKCRNNPDHLFLIDPAEPIES